MIRSKLQDI